MPRRTASVMVCDNPDCEKMSLTSTDEPALGFYFGKGMWHSGGGGGTLPAIYACSEACIIPAIHVSMNR